MKYTAILYLYDYNKHIYTNKGISYNADTLEELQNYIIAAKNNSYKLVSVKNNQSKTQIY